jgi:hypothetical protein
MFASLPARLALIAILVFSQALYAGHSVKHEAGNQAGCDICLQTSAGGAALPCSGIEPTLQVHAPVRPANYVAPAAPVRFTLAHPSRAPPFSPV